MAKEIVCRSSKSPAELISLLQDKANIDSLYDAQGDEHYQIDIDNYTFVVSRVVEQADKEVVFCGCMESYGTGSKVIVTNKSVRRSLAWYVVPVVLTIITSLGAPKDVLVVIVLLFILIAIFIWYNVRRYENALLDKLKQILVIK